METVASEDAADLGVETRHTMTQANSSERAGAVEHAQVVIDGLLVRHWLSSKSPLDHESPSGIEIVDEVCRLDVMLDFRVSTDDCRELGMV